MTVCGLNGGCISRSVNRCQSMLRKNAWSLISRSSLADAPIRAFGALFINFTHQNTIRINKSSPESWSSRSTTTRMLSLISGHQLGDSVKAWRTWMVSLDSLHISPTFWIKFGMGLIFIFSTLCFVVESKELGDGSMPQSKVRFPSACIRIPLRPS